MAVQKGKFISLLRSCAICWFLLNFIQIFFFGLMPIYSLHPIPWSQFLAYITGVPWVLLFIRNFPFSLMPLLITAIGCYFWFRKPNIITGALLIICGALWHIGLDFFRHGLPWQIFVGMAFAACVALIGAWILQRIWNNWDAPAPTLKEKNKRILAERKKWPLLKRLVLLLIPLFLYCASSSLCALGGTYRTVVAKLAGTNVIWKELHGGYYKSGDHIWYFDHIPSADDLTMGGLVKYAWLNDEFGPALRGRSPHSFASFAYSLMSLNRFSFITIFFILYLFWFLRPSWILYAILTTLFLTGVATAKSELVWQFTEPLKDAPWLVERVPGFLYFWATRSPI